MHAPKALVPSWSGSPCLAKYGCTAHHLGKSLEENLPLSASAQQVQHRTKHLALAHRRGLGASAYALKQKTYFFKLLCADVAGTTLSYCNILASKRKIVDTFLKPRRPHALRRRRRRRQTVCGDWPAAQRAASRQYGAGQRSRHRRHCAHGCLHRRWPRSVFTRYSQFGRHGFQPQGQKPVLDRQPDRWPGQ